MPTRDQSAVMKAMRARRLARGLCPYCGRRPPEPGRARCADCLASNSAAASEFRRRRRERGLCPACPAGSTREALPGCSFCFWHLVYFRRTNREYRLRKKKRLTGAGARV